MKITFPGLLLLFLGANLPLIAQPVDAIINAYQLPVGSPVLLEGLISCPDFGTKDGEFFVQDSSGGIKIFFRGVGGESGRMTPYDEGDLIQIEGYTGLAEGRVEIHPENIELIQKGDSIPQPIKIVAAELNVNSNLQGRWVEIANVSRLTGTQWPARPVTTESGTAIAVQVNGQAFTIHIDRGQSYFDGFELPEEPFTLRGILSRQDDRVVLLPFYERDISSTTATNTFEALKLANNLKVYPNPVTDAITLEVKIQAGIVDYVILTDLLGRTVAQYTDLGARNQIIRLPLPPAIRSGQYFLNVWTAHGLRATKLMAIKK